MYNLQVSHPSHTSSHTSFKTVGASWCEHSLILCDRARHVKCDQQRPSCKKCISIGKECPGYDIFRLVLPQEYEIGPVLCNTRPNLIPGITDQERAAFDIFQAHVVGRLCGVFDGARLTSYVIKAAVNERMLFHAALAFTCTGTSTSSSDGFALQQYGKAMSRLRYSFGPSHTQDPNTAVLTCLLLASLGIIRGDYDEAMIHMRGGTAILSPLESMPPKVGVINAFRRLDMSISLSLSSKSMPFPEWFADWMSYKDMLLDPLPVYDLGVLRYRLERLISEIICFIRDAQMLAACGRPNLQQGSPNDMDIRLSLLNQASKQWLRLFESFLANSSPVSGSTYSYVFQTAISLLNLQYLFAFVMLQGGLANGRECNFDTFHAEFNQIVDLATEVAPHYTPQFTSTLGHDLPDSAAFSLDVGIIPILYWTVLKCRHPETRRRALALLSSLKHREGPWSGPTAARCGAKIMRLEEETATAASTIGASVMEASDIPEAARLHEAFFNLKIDEKSLRCKRRKFETNGEWTSYERVVL